jgi:hypothetical protein
VTEEATHPANIVAITGISADDFHEGFAKGGDGGEIFSAQLVILCVLARQDPLYTLCTQTHPPDQLIIEFRIKNVACKMNMEIQ